VRPILATCGTARARACPLPPAGAAAPCPAASEVAGAARDDTSARAAPAPPAQGVVTAGVVYWIHAQNFEERRQMRQGVIKVRAEGRSWVGGREGGSARSHAPGEAPAGTPRDGIWAGICGGRHFVARFPRMLPSVTTLAPRSAFASVCGSAYGRGCTLLQRARARSRCNWCACCVRAHARVRGACVIGWRLSCRVRVCVCMRLCVCARPPWYVILHARIRTQSYNVCVCEREHENTCTRAHTHTHTYKHTHTHTYKHTHTQHTATLNLRLV